MKVIFAVLGLALPMVLSAQNQTLEQYVALGLENNEQLIREQLASAYEEAKLQEVRGQYLPDLSLNATYTRAGGGRTIDVPAGDLVNPIYAGLNRLLEEERYPTDIANVSEQLLPDDFHETKIRLIQPILNSRIYYGYKAQRSALSAQQAQEAAYRNQLTKQIRVGYYQYLSAREQQRILDDTRGLLEELLRVNQKRVDNDQATREVVYAARYELSAIDRRRAAAQKQTATARIYFNFLLNRDLETAIVADTVSFTIPTAPASVAALSETALRNRREVTQLQYGIEATDRATQLSRSYLMPEINLVGDLGYQGFGYTFDDQQDFWLVQLGLTWPIFQGNQNRSRVQQAHITGQQRRSELTDLKHRIALEVAQAYYGRAEAQQQLRASRDGLRNARENFRITAKKYRENLVLLVTCHEARTNYTTAQLEEALARYQLNIREAELQAAVALE